MKRVVVFLVMSLFLMSFVIAQSDNSVGGNNNVVVSSVKDSVKAAVQNKLTEDQIRAIVTERNRIRIGNQTGECPEKCTCTGSVTKCQLANGTREMTIIAGKSGNMIFQVKGINASTRVTLYKSENGSVYGIFKNNETRRIRLLPDQVQERIRERIQRRFENENITLNEDGTYKYIGEKKSRLFFLFPVRARVEAELDPETGKIIKVRNPWWGFLARDEEEIVGASCGTVTPGQNDVCCQNKEFDFYNTETGECAFSE